MTLLKNLYHLSRLTLDMRSANREKGALHKKVQRMMRPIVQASAEYNDGSITPRMHKKMQWYMVETLWMSQQFATLYRLKLDQNAIQCAALVGALGAISDILIDDLPSQNLEALTTFILSPLTKEVTLPLEKLYQAYFKRFDACLHESNRTSVFKYFQRTLEAQLRSKQQFQQNLSYPALIQILKDKCGYTTLLCRAVVNQSISQAEEEAIYELGALVQFINDINDLYKDSKQGIRNFANSFGTLAEIKRALMQQTNLALHQVKQLPYPKKTKRYFLFVFYSFVVVGIAQLRHYKYICNGLYNLDEFLKLPQSKVKIRPFLFRNLRFSVFKILKFNPHIPVIE